LNDGSPVIN